MDFAHGRTRGDGMEFVDTAQSERSNKNISQASATNSTCKSIDESTSRTIPGATTIYRFDDNQSNSVKLPVKIPQGKPFYLVPHLVNSKRNHSLKNKAPKFVPFEPYKAAVSISLDIYFEVNY